MNNVVSTGKKKRRNPMSNEHNNNNFDSFGSFVNGLAVLITISLIGAGYLSALGSFAGVA